MDASLGKVEDWWMHSLERWRTGGYIACKGGGLVDTTGRWPAPPRTAGQPASPSTPSCSNPSAAGTRPLAKLGRCQARQEGDDEEVVARRLVEKGSLLIQKGNAALWNNHVPDDPTNPHIFL